jgi:AcrR family transcriptional regulator
VPRGAASAATDRAPQGGAKRAEILAAATELIAAHGVQGMTMRQLASACGLNIATLYHYFGSKSELLGAIVGERHYDDGLRELSLSIDVALPPRPRLATFFAQLAEQAMGELRLWRMLIGESLRDDAVALAEARRLSEALEHAVDRWLADLFPELGTDPATPDRAAATSVVTGQLLAVFLEEMLLGDSDSDGHGGRDRHRAGRVERRASATAAVVFPAPQLPPPDPT